MAKDKMPTSCVVYSGLSRFDDKPIVAIVTGLRRQSKNVKTGPMAQLWILRADINPLEAINTRQDYSICGDCQLRGSYPDGRGRACYVAVKNAPLAVYRKYAKGE